jgi:hypothetical protein
VKKNSNQAKKLNTRAKALADADAIETRLRTAHIVSVEPPRSYSRIKKKTKKEESLIRVRQQFREEFCRKMDEWANAYSTSLPTDEEYTKRERERFAKAWFIVRASVAKSNALWRLFYAGEELRKTPCPVHKGRWSGCGEDPRCGCWSYGNITGWLAEHPDNPDAPNPPAMMVRLES